MTANKCTQTTANEILVDFAGRDYMKITACGLRTIQEKHLPIPTVLGRNFTAMDTQLGRVREKEGGRERERVEREVGCIDFVECRTQFRSSLDSCFCFVSDLCWSAALLSRRSHQMAVGRGSRISCVPGPCQALHCPSLASLPAC